MNWLTETLNKISKSYKGLNTSSMQGAGSMGLLNIERTAEKISKENGKHLADDFKIGTTFALISGLPPVTMSLLGLSMFDTMDRLRYTKSLLPNPKINLGRFHYDKNYYDVNEKHWRDLVNGFYPETNTTSVERTDKQIDTPEIFKISSLIDPSTGKLKNNFKIGGKINYLNIFTNNKLK